MSFNEDESDPFDELARDLTEGRIEAMKEVNEVYTIIKEKIDNFIKKTGRKTTVEPHLEIIDLYHIEGKIIIVGEKYDEYIIKERYQGKIKDFDVTIITSKHYSSAGAVIELYISAKKKGREEENKK